MIYFDNAATTYHKPSEVIESVNRALRYFSVNNGRSGYKRANELATEVESVRKSVADYVGLQHPSNVVFTHNCTHALNLAILGSVEKGGHVISSVCEHNSVLRPLTQLKESGLISLTLLEPDEDGTISAERVKNAITKSTYMVILQHASNVTGKSQPITAIGEVTSKHNIKFVVDAAQSIGYLPINMEKSHINLLAFPAHKGLHGIVGCGGLCFDDKSVPAPIVYGGTGTNSHLLSQPSDSPEAFESGTMNNIAVLALGEAIKWWNDNYKKLLNQQYKVHEVCQSGLNSVKGVKLYSSLSNASGIISFTVKNLDSGAVCDYLDKEFDIATRGGLHCAPLMHEFLGTTATGLTRVSVSGFNFVEEAHRLVHAVEKLARS